MVFLAAGLAGAGMAQASDAGGEGAQLEASPLYLGGDGAEQTAVGDVYTAQRMGVVNRGSGDAQGLLLEMDVTDGLDFVTRYSNCAYATLPKRTTSEQDTWAQPVTEAVCEIEEPVAAGMYGYLGDPVQVAVNERALADAFHYQVFEDTADARARLLGSAGFTKGTGPALTLGTLKTIHSDEGGNATDTWVEDSSSLPFETHNTADFAADGGSVSGRVGETVKATVGFTNQGPAWFGAEFNTQTVTTFTVPDGAEVVHKPADCKPSIPTDENGNLSSATAYRCFSRASLTVGQKVSYTFTLKIDKAVEKSPGSVEVAAARLFEDTQYAADKNAANNTAAFLLTGKPGKGDGAGGGSGSGGDTSGAGGNAPGAQGRQDTLADTGATGAGAMGGVALAVLAAGGGFWLVGRRRGVRG